VYAHAAIGDCGLGGDFECTTPNYFYGPNPHYQSEFAGSDIHHFSKCFSEDEIDENGIAHYYIGLYCWSLGVFTVRVTEAKTAFYIAASDLSHYQYSYTATRTVLAKCPGDTPQVDWMCQDWRNFCKVNRSEELLLFPHSSLLVTQIQNPLFLFHSNSGSFTLLKTLNHFGPLLVCGSLQIVLSLLLCIAL
jgi:hypothetical protein